MPCPTLQRLLEMERDAWFREPLFLRLTAMFGGGDLPNNLLLDAKEDPDANGFR